MGPTKDCYLHYDNVGDQFVGHYVTGISSLTKQFTILPVYWYWMDTRQHLEDEVNNFIEENLVRKMELPIPIFELLHFYLHQFVFIIST